SGRPTRRDRPERTAQVVVGEDRPEMRRYALELRGQLLVVGDVGRSWEVHAVRRRVRVEQVRVAAVLAPAAIRVGEGEEERAVATRAEGERQGQIRPEFLAVHRSKNRAPGKAGPDAAPIAEVGRRQRVGVDPSHEYVEGRGRVSAGVEGAARPARAVGQEVAQLEL